MAIVLMLTTLVVLIGSWRGAAKLLNQTRLKTVRHLIAAVVGIALAVTYAILFVGYYRSSVHNEAWDGDLPSVKAFVEKGGDVNDRHKLSGGTILSYAAGSGNVELVQYLISKSASATARDNNGTTPLHFAAREHHEGVVRLLVAAGASPNVLADKYERTYTEAHTASMEFPYEGTPLHWAIYSKGKAKVQKDATIKALLDSGANPNVTIARVDPPLELAVVYGNLAIVRMLIKKGADTRTGVALHKAISMDNYEVVKLLIESGCDVNAPARSIKRFQPLDEVVGKPVSLGGRSVTPLSLAKSERIRDLLIKSGAQN